MAIIVFFRFKINFKTNFYTNLKKKNKINNNFLNLILNLIFKKNLKLKLLTIFLSNIQIILKYIFNSKDLKNDYRNYLFLNSFKKNVLLNKWFLNANNLTNWLVSNFTIIFFLKKNFDKNQIKKSLFSINFLIKKKEKKYCLNE